MAVYIKKTISGVPKGIPLTTDSGQGLPLGAWTSFEDDQPRNGYLKAGTTFNQSDYPALYNMLGTNVVPDKGYGLDWDNAEAITLSTSDYVVQKSGWLVGEGLCTQGYVGKLYVNNTAVSVSDYTSGGFSYYNLQIEVKNGDIVKSNRGFATQDFHFIPYLHPMFIKAVIGPIEDSAADQVLQQCINYNSPDWANAQSITLSTSDYVVPDDGWIVGTGLNPSNSQIVKILINGIAVESSIGVTSYHSLPSIQVKVNKGDIVKLNTGSIGSQDFHFVPHK